MFEELLDKEPLRWPKAGDRLLIPSNSRDSRVHFAEDILARECFLWDGYMQAGAVLVAHCLADDRQRHALVYPILFNYRHGLEMAMKWTLNRYGRFASINNYKLDHKLQGLWQKCRTVISDVGGGDDDEAVQAVEDVILEFDALDPGAFAFRYAQGKKGSEIELPVFAIDLENLRDVMSGIDNFFNGLDGQLDANSTSGYFDHY